MSGVAPEDVLNVQAELQRQGKPQEILYRAVIQVLEGHQLLRRELRQTDSLAFHSAEERQRIRAATSQFHILPEAEQRRQPALRHAVGKLQVVAGDYAAAVANFQAVAAWTNDAKPKAEAYMNACFAALEMADWPTALSAFQQAVQLDPERWVSFPIKQYELQRVGGADVFGVFFRCFHRESGAAVIVRPLRADDLDRGADEVLTRNRNLTVFDSPSILKIRAADYVRPERKENPYLVFDQFFSLSLDEHLEKHGPLPPQDFLTTMRLLCEGLQAAHYRNIVHGAVRPGNVFLAQDENGWKVKLTGFGLVLKPSVLQTVPRNTGPKAVTVRSASITRALEYAAPEQVGRLAGVYPGVFSDLYGFGKTCCYALFRTSQPTPQHWQSVPPPVAELLQHCMAEIPEKRPPDFNAVLKRLTQLKVAAPARAAARPAIVPAIVASVAPQPIVPAGAVTARPTEPAAVGPRMQTPAADPWSLAAPPSRARPIWPWVLGGVGLLGLLGVVAVVLLVVLVFNRPPQSRGPTPVVQDNRPPVVNPPFRPGGGRAPPIRPGGGAPPPAPARANPDELRVLTGHKSSVLSVAFGPNGQRVLSGDGDGGIYMWDLDSGRIAQRFLGRRTAISSLAFSSDGRRALSGGLDRSVVLWDTEVGTQKRKFPGNADAVVAVAFSPDGHRIFSFDRAGSLRAWDVDTGEEKYHLTTDDGRVIGFAANGRLALVGGADRALHVVDLETGREERKWMSPQEADFTCLALSSVGNRAFSCGKDKILREWDVATGGIGKSMAGADVGEVISLAFSPDGRRVLAGDVDGNVRLWDVATGTVVRSFPGHKFRVTGVAFSADGRRAVSCGYDQTVRVWKLPD